MATTGPTGTTGLREREVGAERGVREREVGAEASRMQHQTQAQMEAAKREVLQRARETGETVRHGAEDLATRAQIASERVADKYCDMCGQARRRYPKLMTAMIILGALLMGMGLMSALSRVFGTSSYGYGYGGDSTTRELHSALDTLIKNYQSGGGAISGAGRDMMSRLGSMAGGVTSGVGKMAQQYAEQPSRGFGSKISDAIGWGRGGGGYESTGYGYNEGPVMRTVHDAESKLSDLLHGAGHMMHRGGEAVRPR